MPALKKIRIGPGGIFVMRKRANRILPLWRKADAGPGIKGSPLLDQQWAVVLSARNIPYAVAANSGRQSFYVPPLYEGLAREELRSYSAEGGNGAALPAPPVQPGAARCLLFFIPLIIWHCFVSGWDFSSLLPEKFYVRAGALDIARVRIWHEWYRTITALTLHADAGHLLGNVTFGAFFLFFLCRRVGLALALLLTMLGGALGNVLNAIFRSGNVTSMGYSTALFATIGALSGIMSFDAAKRERRKALLPMAAGAALLAMLGTGGERTDYLAHILGLVAGFLLGLLSQSAERFLIASKPAVVIMMAACLVTPIICWILAFNHV